MGDKWQTLNTFDVENKIQKEVNSDATLQKITNYDVNDSTDDKSINSILFWGGGILIPDMTCNSNIQWRLQSKYNFGFSETAKMNECSENSPVTK